VPLSELTVGTATPGPSSAEIKSPARLVALRATIVQATGTMKSGVFGSCVLVMALVSSIAGAQAQTPSAATVLANVQQFYAGTNQLSAAFRQTTSNATFGTSQTSDGHVWVMKPSSFRVDYMEKRNGVVSIAKSFIFDGTTLWMIDHVNKKIVQMQAQSSALPAALSFITGGSALTTQFAVAFATSGKLGAKGTLVLKLTPNQPSAAYKELYLVVDPTDWHVNESLVIDSSGDENDFKFYKPNLGATVKPSWFQVSPSAMPTYKLVKP
jgi:outer membrane lipoprotein-sorting protein